jgi:aspartate carbamoyltransferase catalytic subunit
MFPSEREYRALFGITAERAKKLKLKSIVMHPGPTNRGLEIDPEVADGPKSVILEQVKNGVAMRMAILFIHAGGKIE